jgi:hypothetical protein
MSFSKSVRLPENPPYATGTVAPMNDVMQMKRTLQPAWHDTWPSIRPAGGRTDTGPAIRQRHSPPAM